jgi:hypothetical protein
MIAFDAMLQLARLVGRMVEGTAQTGSSATALVDAVLLGTTLDKVGVTDDEYNGGTVFAITDAGGEGAAPEDETARVTDYDASTGTLTLATGDLSAALASGDYYGLSPIRKDVLLRCVNLALDALGPVPYEDDTSLDTAASTLAYTLPAAAKHDLRQVWIDRSTSTPYYWEAWRYWQQILGKSTSDLVFTVQPPVGKDIRLVYAAPHARLTADASAINAGVSPLPLLWQSAYQYYRELLHTTGRDNREWETLASEASQKAELYKSQYPVRLPPNHVRLPSESYGAGYYGVHTGPVATS